MVRARNEARAASDWYREQNPYAAERFEGTLRAALADICETPQRWPAWRATQYRRYIVLNFPYSIIYRLLDDGRVLWWRSSTTAAIPTAASRHDPRQSDRHLRPHRRAHQPQAAPRAGHPGGARARGPAGA
ncbi:type II toxin-antitoxin system RelE/ParE family toxin [Nannocystis pusilla]|uniref:Type II toxin-antitoxin system RelE/ParE family toxin n=1 Tax=Nannocystis pusilla TaxID=889268 RepID=A0ABS7TMM0_9BACT|nr:type II toxin-antitoxin system RelE/ParE family toxin [Nannocystis pusilla]